MLDAVGESKTVYAWSVLKSDGKIKHEHKHNRRNQTLSEVEVMAVKNHALSAWPRDAVVMAIK